TADEIIAYRTDHPFTAASQIGNVSPFLRDLFSHTLINTIVDVQSTYFHVRSSGDVGGTVRTIDAIGIRVGTEVQWRFWRIE
ncbi:MAG: hypothetical protein ACYC37_08610, partial [Desulfobacteria bacterium]